MNGNTMTPGCRSTWLVLFLIAGLVPRIGLGVAAQGQEREVFSRSLVSAGDMARLQQAIAKAGSGETVTIGVIGGSITQGAAASQPEKRYGDLVAAWWRKAFPKAKVEFVNAGIGATGSDYGALRVKRDLLSRHPDFVVVEYAVNDPDNDAAAETVEGLVRQILGDPNPTAVLLLFTINQSGGNAQKAHSKIGRHYGLPMVSFRDALWPEIEQGRLKWNEVEADAVHPNDRGHEYCARFIIQLLEKVMTDVVAGATPSQLKPLPVPLYTDVFEHVALFEADALKPVANEGWTLDAARPSERCWKADKPGSSIEFEVEGTVVLIMDWHLRGPMGQAKVQVDDLPPVVREAWFDQTWGGYRMTTVLARDLKPGKHSVKIQLLSESNPQSTGHEFRLMGLGAAGVEASKTNLAPILLRLPAPSFFSRPVDFTVPDPHVEPRSPSARPPFLAPVGATNLAFQKPVTASDTNVTPGTLSKITDGEKDPGDGNAVQLHTGQQWVQVDLEGFREIFAIVIWHRETERPIFQSVVVQVADDAAMTMNVHTLFNNDYANILGLGAGGDKQYVESNEGRLIDAKGIRGRYVRCYSKGNNQDRINYYTEIEVWGLPGY